MEQTFLHHLNFIQRDAAFLTRGDGKSNRQPALA